MDSMTVPYIGKAAAQVIRLFASKWFVGYVLETVSEGQTVHSVQAHIVTVVSLYRLDTTDVTVPAPSTSSRVNRIFEPFDSYSLWKIVVEYVLSLTGSTVNTTVPTVVGVMYWLQVYDNAPMYGPILSENRDVGVSSDAVVVTSTTC